MADARVIRHGGRRGCAPCLVICGLTSLASSAAAGCASRTHPASASALPVSNAASFPDDDRPLPRFRSRRLALSLPLPDGRAWRIDDHSQPSLVATHAPTRSHLMVSVFSANELVGRARCEELARARTLVPDEPKARRVVEDEVVITQETFDTRVEVTLEPGSGPDRSLGGRVAAFGGYLRKCYAFVYSTQVDHAADEAVLSARLAFARARILGGLELEAFDAVARESLSGPKVAPGR